MTGDIKKLCLIEKNLFILFSDYDNNESYYVISLHDYAETGISIWDNYDEDNFEDCEEELEEELKKYYQVYSVEDFLERYPESKNFEWESYYKAF